MNPGYYATRALRRRSASQRSSAPSNPVGDEFDALNKGMETDQQNQLKSKTALRLANIKKAQADQLEQSKEGHANDREIMREKANKNLEDQKESFQSDLNDKKTALALRLQKMRSGMPDAQDRPTDDESQTSRNGGGIGGYFKNLGNALLGRRGGNPGGTTAQPPASAANLQPFHPDVHKSVGATFLGADKKPYRITKYNEEDPTQSEIEEVQSTEDDNENQ